MLHELYEKRSRSSRRWNSRDTINVAILAVLNLALRCSFFNVQILNIDEAEYMADAAFLQATGQSAFTFATLPYTIETFKVSAELFGRYNPAPARMTVALIAFVVAVFIYRWLARDTSRVLALASTIFFLVWNFIFEGAIMAREWPCALAVLAGAHLFMTAQRRSDSRRSRLVFAAGLTTSLALFFKEQAAYMTLAAPLWLVFKAAGARRWQPWLGQGLLYLCGGLLGGLIYATPFLINGTLLTHIQGELKFGSVYTTDTTLAGSPVLQNYRHVVSEAKVGCLFFLLAGAWCCVQVTRALCRLRRRAANRDGDVRRDRELLAIFYVGTATAVVQMGRQFFLHYFLFWIPFTVIVEGYAIHALARLCARRRGGGAVAAIIAFGALVAILFFAPNAVGWSAAGAAAVMALAGWVCFPRPIPPSRLVGAISAAMALLAAGAAGVLHKEVVASAADQAINRPGIEAREFFARHSHPRTDRLFVWGWRPEYYCASGLVPANRYIVCNGVLNAFWSATAIDNAVSDEVMAELRSNPPRFIVTGPRTEKSFGRTLYPLHAFPALEQWLRRDYRLAVELPDCEIYQRQSKQSAGEQ